MFRLKISARLVGTVHNCIIRIQLFTLRPQSQAINISESFLLIAVDSRTSCAQDMLQIAFDVLWLFPFRYLCDHSERV